MPDASDEPLARRHQGRDGSSAHSLTRFLENVFLPIRLAGRSEGHQASHRRAVRTFAEFRGGRAGLADLTARNVGLWMISLSELGYPSGRIQELRRCLNSIWRYAVCVGLVERYELVGPVAGNAVASKPAPRSGYAGLSKTPVGELLAALQLESGFTDETLRVYQSHWKGACEWLGMWAFEQIGVSDLNRYLTFCERNGHAASTVHSIRRSLLVAMRAAHERWPQLVPKPKLRKVRRADLLPEAWTRHEVSLVVAAAESYHGWLPGWERRSDWWASFCEAAWHTGLRRTDLLLLERGEFDQSGNAVIRQHKTGKRIPIWLPANVLEARPDRGKLWVWKLSYETFRRQFSEIVSIAGIPSGPFKRLRKSAGNEAERLRPGMGHEFLGNERRTFERYYRLPTNLPITTLPSVHLEEGATNPKASAKRRVKSGRRPA